MIIFEKILEDCEPTKHIDVLMFKQIKVVYCCSVYFQIEFNNRIEDKSLSVNIICSSADCIQTKTHICVNCVSVIIKIFSKPYLCALV